MRTRRSLWLNLIFVQHLKTTRIKLSNDWALIRRQPFVETLLGDTQLPHIRVSPLSAVHGLPSPPCSLPQSSPLKTLIWICQTWWRVYFVPPFTDACPCHVSGLESVWDVCPAPLGMHDASLSLSLSLPPPWKTSLYSFFANVCGTGINMLCAKWITAN